VPQGTRSSNASNHCGPPREGILKTALSQKTCQGKLNNIQLSGERHGDSRMRVILLFSFFLNFRKQPSKKFFDEENVFCVGCCNGQ
jgi:hypothetical protein